MSDRADEIEAEIESLLDRVIDGSCDEKNLCRFEALVRDNPRARTAYLEQMRVHALLEWQHGQVELRIEPAAAGADRIRAWLRTGGRYWGLAALLLVGVGLLILGARFAIRQRGDAVIATLSETRDVIWAEGQPVLASAARLVRQSIRFRSGTIQLRFDSGTQVSVQGPADLWLVSDRQMRVERGRITARIDGPTRTFAIDTPNVRVVDRGTEFGVEADARGQTIVVVFKGLVDLLRPGSVNGSTPIRQLSQGEAARVDRAGGLGRVVAVEHHPGADSWTEEAAALSEPGAIVRSVRDNIQDPDNFQCYQVVRRGLYDDAPAYVDRPHQWNGIDRRGIPAFLRGADYVMPFNEAKGSKDLEIRVELACAASLYVFFDDREKPPSWLRSRFIDTGVNIGLDEGSWPDPSKFSVAKGPGRSIDTVFSVWKRDTTAGERVQLGAIQGAKDRRAMYGIAAVARP